MDGDARRGSPAGFLAEALPLLIDTPVVGDRLNVSAMIATAVNADGKREIVGFDVVTTKDTEAWTAFLRSLVDWGLSGVELVVSDAHGGIKAAIASVFAGASWQRCRTHFMATWPRASRRAPGRWSRRSCARSSSRPTRRRPGPSSATSSTSIELLVLDDFPLTLAPIEVCRELLETGAFP